MLVDTDNTTINKMNIPIEVALGIRLLLKRCEQLAALVQFCASGKIALKLFAMHHIVGVSPAKALLFAEFTACH